MIADHPTESDATELAMPIEADVRAPLVDSEVSSVPLPLPVSVEAETGSGDAEPATAEVPVESDVGGLGVGESDELADDVVGSAEDVGEAAEDESRPVTDARESAEEVGEALEPAVDKELKKDWYILKVQVNREESIRDALLRRIKIEGLENLFGDIIVPTEEVAEFNKTGKRRVVRRKLYPGYILVHMAISDDTWFLVRETPGVGDFTGSAGKPTPMEIRDVERILRLGTAQEERGGQIKTAIPFKTGDRVRVKDGHFQNFEGEVDAIDEANGRITVMINIFNRSTPVELEHWQVESV